MTTPADHPTTIAPESPALPAAVAPEPAPTARTGPHLLALLTGKLPAADQARRGALDDCDAWLRCAGHEIDRARTASPDLEALADAVNRVAHCLSCALVAAAWRPEIEPAVGTAELEEQP
jgi:hypothetical protein